MMMLMALEALSSADCKCRVQWWWSSRYETFLPTRVRMMDDGRRSEREEEGGLGGWNNFPPWPGNHNLPRRPLSPETLTPHTLTADREEDLKLNISWALGLGLGRVKLSCPYHFFHSIHWWTYQSQLKTGAKKMRIKELSALDSEHSMQARSGILWWIRLSHFYSFSTHELLFYLLLFYTTIALSISTRCLLRHIIGNNWTIKVASFWYAKTAAFGIGGRFQAKIWHFWCPIQNLGSELVFFGNKVVPLVKCVGGK